MGILRSGGMPTERSGLAGAARSLAAFRLAGVKDSPADIPLGAYGDEFEYRDRDTFSGIWVPTGSLADNEWLLCGSHVFQSAISPSTNGEGFVFDAGGNFPDDFEVAVLQSGVQVPNNMVGIAVTDSSGVGIGCSAYTGGLAYLWSVGGAGYIYQATWESGTGLSDAQLWAPHWFALRRSSGNWRFRWSADGATWTTIVASAAHSLSNLRRIYIGPMFASSERGAVIHHRVVYGTADLGL